MPAEQMGEVGLPARAALILERVADGVMVGGIHGFSSSVILIPRKVNVAGGRRRCAVLAQGNALRNQRRAGEYRLIPVAEPGCDGDNTPM
jgi:hypothetical protein